MIGKQDGPMTGCYLSNAIRTQHVHVCQWHSAPAFIKTTTYYQCSHITAKVTLFTVVSACRSVYLC